MENKILYVSTALIASLALLSANTSMAVMGTTTGKNRVPGNAENRAASTKNPGRGLAQIQDKSNNEIDKRVTALDNLAKRVSEMKNVSDIVKAGILTQTQTSIDNLTALKEKISVETNASTTINDKKTITENYRIFALVIPQGYIVSAADRINSISQTLMNLSAKLAAKIAEAQTSGNDVAKLQTSLTDMNSLIADAKNQSQLATAGVSSLTPDQGDQIKAQSNHAALVAARANIKTATQDINAARKDALAIMQALKGFGIKVTPSTSTSTTVANASTTASN